MRAVKTDVLIVGGGIAGCFAAIATSKQAQSWMEINKRFFTHPQTCESIAKETRTTGVYGR